MNKVEKNLSTNKYFEDFNLNDSYLIPSRTQTSGIFSMFQAASGDNDPIHYDVEYCKKRAPLARPVRKDANSVFNEAIAPSMRRCKSSTSISKSSSGIINSL